MKVQKSYTLMLTIGFALCRGDTEGKCRIEEVHQRPSQEFKIEDGSKSILYTEWP